VEHCYYNTLNSSTHTHFDMHLRIASSLCEVRTTGWSHPSVISIVIKFLGRWGRGTGSRYVVRYSREIFTLRVENEPVNPGRGRQARVKGRRW
jgi:hypothetical protein